MKNIRKIQYPSKELLQEYFNYDSKLGELRWSINACRNINKVAGRTNGPYKYVGFKYKSYALHNCIWIYHNGDIPQHLVVDHKNRNSLDNKIENLRLLTELENSWNTRAKGYYWSKQNNKYIAQLQCDGEYKYLGQYDTALEAKIAYFIGKNKYHVISEHNVQ